MSNLNKKRILLGVTGSIAVYKAVELASKLTQAGAMVDVVMTRSATQFVTPLAFSSVTGRAVVGEDDLWGGQGHVLHIGLAHEANLLVIAPCTANTMAKLAHGIADNLLTITALAARCPILLAPAMDAGMFDAPATLENVATLKARGIRFAGPVAGRMASGLVGVGRMIEPADLLGHIRAALGIGGKLAGKKVLVTAGGSQQALDPVRYITNRSSGKQGYAIAQSAIDAGAEVTLITHPTSITPPAACKKVIEVESAADMLLAVEQQLRDGSDCLIMAAAVADFTPVVVKDQKIKKRDGIDHIELQATEDILAKVANMRPMLPALKCVVGFAAESQELLANAAEKLANKKLDMIVANDISAKDAGFAVDDNRVVILFQGGRSLPISLASKDYIGDVVIAQAAALMDQK